MVLAEIIFSTVGFIIFWLMVFKVALIYDEKKRLKDIGKKIEDQGKKTFNLFGKNVRAGEVVEDEDGEEEEPVTAETKPKPKTKKKKVVKKTAKKTTKKVSKKKK